MPDGIDWLDLISTVLRASGKRKLSLHKICKRGAKKAHPEATADRRKALKEELKHFVDEAGVSGKLIVASGFVSLPTSPDKSPAQHKLQATEDTAETQAPRREAVASVDAPDELGKTKPKRAQQKSNKRKKVDPADGQEAAGSAPKKARYTKQNYNWEDLPTAHLTIDEGCSEEQKWRDSSKRLDRRHGRFSKAERQAILDAVHDYEEEKQLGHEHKWLYESIYGRLSEDDREHVLGAWNVIAGASCPNRTIRAVYMCAIRMLHPYNKKGRWTPEEDKELVALHAKLGPQWTKIGEALKRMPSACRDRYRDVSTCNEDTAKGAWADDERERLREAVAEYLEAQKEVTATLSSQDIGGEDEHVDGKKQKAPALTVLDNIDWAWVAQQVRTRPRGRCMQRWYDHECPSMVTRGEWGIGDDRRLIRGMLEAQATQLYQVPWDTIVAGRTAKQTQRRWRLMLKRVKDASEKSFTEQLEYIIDKFLPGLKKKSA